MFWTATQAFKLCTISCRLHRELLTTHEEKSSEVNVKDFLSQSPHLNSTLRLQN